MRPFSVSALLWGGISTQAEEYRAPEQVQDSMNLIPDRKIGLIRRSACYRGADLEVGLQHFSIRPYVQSFNLMLGVDQLKVRNSSGANVTVTRQATTAANLNPIIPFVGARFTLPSTQKVFRVSPIRADSNTDGQVLVHISTLAPRINQWVYVSDGSVTKRYKVHQDLTLLEHLDGVNFFLYIPESPSMGTPVGNLLPHWDDPLWQTITGAVPHYYLTGGAKHYDIQQIGGKYLVTNRQVLTRTAYHPWGDNTFNGANYFNRWGFIKFVQGVPDNKYQVRITIAGTPYDTYITSGSTASGFALEKMAEVLYTHILTWKPANLLVYHEGNTIFFYNKTGLLNIESQAEPLMIASGSTVSKFVDLPRTAGPLVGVYAKVGKEQDSGYFVRYHDNAWEECADPMATNSLDPLTLPHILETVQGAQPYDLASASFYAVPNGVEGLSWATRQVGDNDTNPIPVFVDSPITHIRLYKGRLWFTSGTDITASRPNDVFNLFASSTKEILDDDPINKSIEAGNGKTIRYCILWLDSLVCATENSLIQLKGVDGIVTTDKLASNTLTDSVNLTDISPGVYNNSLIYLLSEFGDNALMEMITPGATPVRLNRETQGHLNGVKGMCLFPEYSMILFWNDSTTVTGIRYEKAGDEPIIMSTFKLGYGSVISGIRRFEWHDTRALEIELLTTNTTLLQRMDLTGSLYGIYANPLGADYDCGVGLQLVSPSQVFINTGYYPDVNLPDLLIVGQSTSLGTVLLDVTSRAGNTFDFTPAVSDLTQATLYIVPPAASVTLSRAALRDYNDRVIIAGRATVKRLVIQAKGTEILTVTVTRTGAEPRLYTYLSRQAGITPNDSRSFEPVTVNVPVHAPNNATRVTISQPVPSPLQIQTVTQEGVIYDSAFTARRN